MGILCLSCRSLPPTELEPYKYAGYPMLIKTITMETEDEQLFSKTSPLLPASTELAFHTVSCSALNAEELRRENGIEVSAPRPPLSSQCLQMTTLFHHGELNKRLYNNCVHSDLVGGAFPLCCCSDRIQQTGRHGCAGKAAASRESPGKVHFLTEMACCGNC